MKCDCSKKGCGDIFGFRGFTKENFKVNTAQLAFKVIFACKIVFRKHFKKKLSLIFSILDLRLDFSYLLVLLPWGCRAHKPQQNGGRVNRSHTL